MSCFWACCSSDTCGPNGSPALGLNDRAAAAYDAFTMSVAFVSSPCFVEHVTGSYHPERPDRIRAIHRAVRDAGLIDSPDPFPEFQIDLGIRRKDSVKLLELAPQPADPKWLRSVHTEEM